MTKWQSCLISKKSLKSEIVSLFSAVSFVSHFSQCPSSWVVPLIYDLKIFLSHDSLNRSTTKWITCLKVTSIVMASWQSCPILLKGVFCPNGLFVSLFFLFNQTVFCPTFPQSSFVRVVGLSHIWFFFFFEIFQLASIFLYFSNFNSLNLIFFQLPDAPAPLLARIHQLRPERFCRKAEPGELPKIRSSLSYSVRVRFFQETAQTSVTHSLITLMFCRLQPFRGRSLGE